MTEKGGRHELDRLVARILSSFELDEHFEDARWRKQLRDLRRILRADYRATVADLHRAGLLPVRSMIRDARREFPELNERPVVFDDRVRQLIADLGIALLLQAHPRRMPLRAFYHRGDAQGMLIWLNAAHPAAAVAASLGHELGHWYRERLLGAPKETETLAFFNSNFADHLTQPDELFADIFPVLAAYPYELARRIFPAGGWRRGLSEVARLEGATIGRIKAHLRSSYGFDLRQHHEHKPPGRLYYGISMIHFARLRWAVLEVCGV